ncbi:hypothetical protein Dimus_019432 [Dionaea muscipula]
MECEQHHDDYNFGSITPSSSSSYSAPAAAAAAIDSSNIGFQLLKKHGWKEGTGLGAYEQGRLEPVEACVKKNKRGLGAVEVKKNSRNPCENGISVEKHKKEGGRPSTKKEKMISKRIKKMEEVERRLQEREFERQFFREFWPDNV